MATFTQRCRNAFTRARARFCGLPTIRREDYPENAIVLSPIAVVRPDANGALGVEMVDEDSGRPIKFAGIEACVVALVQNTSGTHLHCQIKNVPVVQEQS